MGYTHYWTSKKLDDGYSCNFIDKVRTILEMHSDFVQYEDDDASRPHADGNCIRFNGIGDDGHETFFMAPVGEWTFCKTAQKPYDQAVMMVLIAALDHGCIEGLSTDGEFDFEWLQARNVYASVFGGDPIADKCPVGVTGNKVV